jgi:hypothetical protein
MRVTWEFFRWALIAFIAARTIVAAELIALLVLFELADRSLPGAYEAYFAFGDMTLRWDGALVAISIAAFAAAALMLVIFIYRGLSQLEQANAPDVKMSPLFGALGGIIPFAAGFVPLGAVRQIWRGANSLAKRQDQMPVSLFLWWTMWIIASLLAIVTTYAERAAESEGYATAESFRNAVYLNVGMAVAFIISSIFLLRVSRRIMRTWDIARAGRQDA